MIRRHEALLPVDGAGESPFSLAMVIVYIAPDLDRVYLMPSQGPLRRPSFTSLDQINDWVKEDQLRVARVEPRPEMQLPDTALSPKSLAIRDKRWEAVRSILGDDQALGTFLVSGESRGTITRLARATGHSRATLYYWIWLGLRWFGVRDGLLPLRRQVSDAPSQKIYKVGRPRTLSPGIGVNIGAKELNEIHLTLDRDYINGDCKTLTETFDSLLEKFYTVDRVLLPDGRPESTHQGPECRLSLDQFRYHAAKYLRAKGLNPATIRLKRSEFQKDLAGRTGQPIQAEGPGHIYQIDATIGDIELVSSLDPSRRERVGRPTIYAVADTFSSLIVGLTVTLSPPSYDGARLALYHAFSKKEGYCKKYGLSISAADWPAEGVCSQLWIDNAELRARLGDALVQNTGISLVSARPYRGDDKGPVEQTFNRLNKVLRKQPGAVTKKTGTRGTRPAKESALLNINEITCMLLEEVITYNTTVVLKADHMPLAVAREMTSATSLDLWMWGCVYRPHLREWPDQQLYIAMLETGKAAVSRNAIYFQGIWYTCEWTRKSGMQDQKPNRRSTVHLQCYFTRNSVDEIFLLTPQGSIVTAFIAPRSSRLQGLSFCEARHRLDVEKRAKARRTGTQRAARADSRSFQKSIVEKARASQQTITAAELSGQSIRENRSKERQLEARSEAARHREVAASGLPEQLANTDADQRAEEAPNKQDARTRSNYVATLRKKLEK